jgi:hypothetical protein
MKILSTSLIVVPAAALLLALGCHIQRNKDPGGDTAGGPVAGGGRLDASRSFAEAFETGNLTIWPIIAEQLRELGEFLTLTEAEGKGVAEVKEVGSGSVPGDTPESHANQGSLVQLQAPHLADGARVNELRIENKGDLPILVCSGTIVKGGKQDRQIGQDIVIAPKSSVPVEAFCIEAQRWEVNRDGSDTRGLFMPLPVIAAKDVRASAQYFKSQTAVWENVSKLNSAGGKSPRTATFLATVEDSDAGARSRREGMEREVRAHFDTLRSKGQRPVGFAYAVNGKPVSVRTFAHPRIFEGQFEPFVKAMCIEADLGGAPAGAKPAKASLDDVLALVRSINEQKETVSETSAGSKLGLRHGEAGGNSNCYLPASAAGGELVPVTQDWTSTK